jgi:hypothetical protein
MVLTHLNLKVMNVKLELFFLFLINNFRISFKLKKDKESLFKNSPGHQTWKFSLGT